MLTSNLKTYGKRLFTRMLERRLSLLLACTVAAILPFYAHAALQENISVSGKVVDASGNSMAGVTVIETGTTNGITTFSDGLFRLEVSPGAMVSFSFIGYETQNIAAGNLVNATVVMSESATEIEQLVVVGYGVQKKVNLTGSVSSVNMSEMVEGRPVTSLSSGLSGLSAGLYVQQATGRPNADGATMLLRGQGTLNETATSTDFSKSQPLIVIDGMISSVSEMNAINPHDVEQISLLKDAASSSIYGTRGANGVILITTKKGQEGRFTVNYNGYLAFAKPSNTIATVSNYADYMEYYNEAYKNTNPSAAAPFRDSTIQLWRENNDPYMYPNTDWRDEIFQTGVINNHSLSFTGGTQKLRAFGSFGYLDNPGIIENSAFKQYNARVNVSADVNKWLTLGMNARGSYGNADYGSKSMSGLFNGIGTPGIVYRHPDGRYGGPETEEENQQVQSPLYGYNSSRGHIITRSVQARMFGTVRIIEGLEVDGSFSYSYNSTIERETPLYADLWSFSRDMIVKVNTEEETYARNRFNENYHLQMDAVIRYNRDFFNNRLAFAAMAGAAQEKYETDWFEAMRRDLIDDGLTSINAATGEQSASGVSPMGYSMHSYFGRLNFAWDNKYLLEANLRVDQSSKFHSNYRTGVFPSVSAGWRIDQEVFLKDIRWIDILKLRVSYGSLGNDNIGNFAWQATYSKSPYVLNNSIVNGMKYALSNSAVKWEATYITNVGVDFGFLSNRLEGSAEYFYKDSKDILVKRVLPGVAGTVAAVAENLGRVSNEGVELSLKWRDRVGDFHYYAGGNFTYLKNRVRKFTGSERMVSGANMIMEGYPINVQYVYKVDRLIKTDSDLLYVRQMIDNAPYDENGVKRNPFAAVGDTPGKGDFLYRDVNGDGIIDENDKIAVGHGMVPPITYGMQLGGSWKGIDLSLVLQGVKGYRVLWMDNFNMGYINHGGVINKQWAENAWRESDPMSNYPRLNVRSGERNNFVSDYWVADKSYMRIKNIQVGYQFPRQLTEKIGISTLRLYVSLENYFTFTNYKGIDPEVSGTTYPTLKQTSVGLNITF